MSTGVATLLPRHVFGMKGDVRANLHYLDEGSVLYPAGHNTIIYQVRPPPPPARLTSPGDPRHPPSSACATRGAGRGGQGPGGGRRAGASGTSQTGRRGAPAPRAGAGGRAAGRARRGQHVVVALPGRGGAGRGGRRPTDRPGPPSPR